jgi:hypothetical protein
MKSHTKNIKLRKQINKKSTKKSKKSNKKTTKKSKKSKKSNKKSYKIHFFTRQKIGGIGGEGETQQTTMNQTNRKRERETTQTMTNIKKTKPETENPIHRFFVDNRNILAEGAISINKNIEINRKTQLIAPTDFSVETYGMFITLFKKYIIQPFIRKYLVNKYNPGIPYAMLRIDYKDNQYKEKLQFIRILLHDDQFKNYDFILDIAEAFESGGHYSALKRKDGKIVYMDPDPFFYGNGPHPAFNKLLVGFNNPVEMYGDTNKNNEMESIKSIQNINKFDYNCQSWSLLYLTIPNFIHDLPNKINYNTGDIILHEDINKQMETFPLFIENFKLIISFWITILEENNNGLNNLIRYETSQFNNWRCESIVQELTIIKQYIMNLMNNTNMTPEQKYNEYKKIFYDFQDDDELSDFNNYIQ